MQRLMIVDDEKNVLTALQRVFREQDDWEVESYNDPRKALERAEEVNFDLFLSDYRMPEMDGVQFLSTVKNLQADAMRLILSGQTDRDGLLGAINKAQIYRFIEKPWSDHSLISVLQQALDYRDILLENRILASQVRDQQRELELHKLALEKYKECYPNIFNIDWDVDGSIMMNLDK